MSEENSMYIAGVVMTYWFVSISMVYLNKELMSNEGLSIPAPLFVTWYQCIITSVICKVAGICGQRTQNQHNYSRLNTNDSVDPNAPVKMGFFQQFPKASYHIGIAVRILPLSFIFLGMITFNNLCLKYVEVSFYNVGRSLTIVFNVIFSGLLLGIPTSKRTIFCLCIVISGFYVGSQGEINFSLVGTICGVLSSLFVSLNSIFTKRVLPIVEDNHWRLTWYNNINSCILLIPLVYIYEFDIIVGNMERLTSGAFWSAMTLGGFFGFAIGIVTVLQIKATSPLSHNISGTAKAAFQSMLAFYIWGNEPTALGILGIFTVLGGSLLYTYVKMDEAMQLSSSSLLSKQPSDLEMQKDTGGES